MIFDFLKSKKIKKLEERVWKINFERKILEKQVRSLKQEIDLLKDYLGVKRIKKRVIPSKLVKEEEKRESNVKIKKEERQV